MEEKQKIMICGDVEGKFKALFKKVDTVNNKSGPFDLLLCVGNFFGVNNKEFEIYKNNEEKVPIPTYILGPNKEEHVHHYPEEESELCPNVYYLGKRGLYTNSSGLKIAYISGIFTPDSPTNLYTYKIEDAVALRDACKRGNPNFRGVDILITSQWPQGILKYDSKYKGKSIVNMYTPAAAWLNAQLKPRYHVSGLEGVFCESQPFRYKHLSDHDPVKEFASRFLGLARVKNPKKEKWIYALSLTPLDKMNAMELIQKTTDETQCPFSLNDLERTLFKIKRQPLTPDQYFYDMNTYKESTNQNKGKRQKMEFDQSKCWFCLGSPSVERHLVISVGTAVYVALAKGGIVEEHLLICPIEHHRCALELPEVAAREIQHFKKVIKTFFIAKDKLPVFYERNYKTSHMQIQVIPVPFEAMNDIREIFEDEAGVRHIKLEKLEKQNRLDQVVSSGSPYFYVELPDDSDFYTKIQPSVNFPLNFCREVLASGLLLDVPDRVDWKQCCAGKQSEEVTVERLRSEFQIFNIISKAQ